MPTAAANGIEICFETFGDPAHPTVLLINGLGSQLLGWDEGFCRRLAERGHHVVRFDNRDVGLSTWFDDVPYDFAAGFAAFRSGDPVPAPYTLSDMAADAVGLLDHLGVDRAHVVGMSMGGMIAQTAAIDHPGRVASLCSIMSTTGEREVGRPTPEANAALLAKPPKTRDDAVALAVANARVIGSPPHVDPERVGAIAGAAYDRAFHPIASARQLLAVWQSGSRLAGLQALSVPTLVIHGRCDPLIQLDGGLRTAEVVPGADLLVLGDMGHDLAPPLWGRVVDAISALVARAG